MNIVAAIVTYNRKAMLMECLEALFGQTWTEFQIIVIDNASSDGTEEALSTYIKEKRILYRNTGTNLGGAGGFNRAIRTALENQADYIWLMDDDTIPDEDALEKLLTAAKGLNYDFGFLSSKAVWKDGKLCRMNEQKLYRNPEITVGKQKLLKCRQATFVSFFINASVISKLGLPISEFFIWGDDIEYSRRISAKVMSYYVPSSCVLHKTANNEGSNITTDDYSRIDRYRYAYRNEMYIARKEGPKRMLYQLCKIFYHIMRTLLFAKEKRMKKIGIIISASLEGRHFNPGIEY